MPQPDQSRSTRTDTTQRPHLGESRLRLHTASISKPPPKRRRRHADSNTARQPRSDLNPKLTDNRRQRHRTHQHWPPAPAAGCRKCLLRRVSGWPLASLRWPAVDVTTWWSCWSGRALGAVPCDGRNARPRGSGSSALSGRSRRFWACSFADRSKQNNIF